MVEQQTTYHTPVMLAESISALDIRPDGLYADCTFGGGGHSRALLSQLGPAGHLFGFDQDADACANALADERFTFVQSNFRHLGHWMRYYGVEQLDGVLADLGLSSHHLDAAERGFSFRHDAPLDMRMNRRAALTAAQVVEQYGEEQLADVFYLYGELKNARRLAGAVVRARQQQPIATTGQLQDVVLPLLPRERQKKDLARVFQALRIEVNGEMEALSQMLTAAVELLRPGGRLVVITYHSLEDRIVKNVFRAGNAEGRCQQDIYGRSCQPLRPVGRPATPTEQEQAANPRSRSAKLRVAERVNNESEE